MRLIGSSQVLDAPDQSENFTFDNTMGPRVGEFLGGNKYDFIVRNKIAQINRVTYKGGAIK